jgi:hypothetical protein
MSGYHFPSHAKESCSSPDRTGAEELAARWIWVEPASRVPHDGLLTTVQHRLLCAHSGNTERVRSWWSP